MVVQADMSIRSLLALGVGHRLLSNVDESVLVQLELNEFDAHHNPESERSCPSPPIIMYSGRSRVKSFFSELRLPISSEAVSRGGYHRYGIRRDIFQAGEVFAK